MWRQRPGRLPGFDYVGCLVYSVTICTAKRVPAFAAPTVAEECLLQLRRTAREERFALLALCFMHDHVHLIVVGQTRQASLPRFIARFKQATGYWYRQATGRPLWQSGYLDWVLRDDESVWNACKYVLANPVRKGLARTIGEYPFAVSDTFRMEDFLLESYPRD